LGSFERLTLALLVATKNKCLIWRVQIQADDVPELVVELRVIRDLEGTREIGFRSFLLQIDCTLWCEMPKAEAILRVLQRSRPGGDCVTLVIACRTLSSGREVLRPRPALSMSPSNPWASNRFDHNETVFKLTPTSAATSSSLCPSARERTMRARRLSRCVEVVARARRRNSAPSSGVTSMREMGRAIGYWGSMERKTGLRVCEFDRIHDPLPSGDKFGQFRSQVSLCLDWRSSQLPTVAKQRPDDKWLPRVR